MPAPSVLYAQRLFSFRPLVAHDDGGEAPTLRENVFDFEIIEVKIPAARVLKQVRSDLIELHGIHRPLLAGPTKRYSRFEM